MSHLKMISVLIEYEIEERNDFVMAYQMWKGANKSAQICFVKSRQGKWPLNVSNTWKILMNMIAWKLHCYVVNVSS